MQHKKWSLPTRILHLGLVLTVSAQLFISLIMEEPDEVSSGISHLAFNAHEIIGLFALLIVFLHWGWSVFTPSSEGTKHLLPWTGTARDQVLNDLKRVFRGKFPSLNKHGGLIGLIHGLGLLAVTGIAATGGVLYFIYPETGEPGWIAEAYTEIHEFLATLVWIYWIGHVGMAILHEVNGRRQIVNMFFMDKTKKTFCYTSKTSN